MEVVYAPSFVRQFGKLEKALQDEAIEKIRLFQKNPKSPQLKTHKLKGRLRGKYSFSVNYKTRIVFIYASKRAVALLAIGDHEVYND